MSKPQGFKHYRKVFKGWFSDKELIAVLEAGIQLCGVNPNRDIVIVYQNRQVAMSKNEIVTLAS